MLLCLAFATQEVIDYEPLSELSRKTDITSKDEGLLHHSALSLPLVGTNNCPLFLSFYLFMLFYYYIHHFYAVLCCFYLLFYCVKSFVASLF